MMNYILTYKLTCPSCLKLIDMENEPQRICFLCNQKFHKNCSVCVCSTPGYPTVYLSPPIKGADLEFTRNTIQI